ncbi:netrin-G1-like isoform X2 [Scophthalmus maximus]|uniref:netrin-G1-like isoform X2 n=1 Tax=Scophthalmus maximus TaxID=52904 RepID=UPI000F32D424|nr:netrin-G1-like isoform X2 [Scophthalmus maximus]
MLWPVFFTLQAVCTSVAHTMQHYPAAWGHYDVCKSQIYTEEGLAWDYMACQPEATDMTKYLRVALDPPNVTCGDPPETYCALENPYMCNNECDATTEELAHPPELMFDFEGRNPTTFWQSTSWKKYPKPLQVNITLSWNKTVELTDDIVLTFESGRPEQMVLEKSLDYGRTWTPYQFYATDCLDAFTMEPKTVGDLTQRTLLDIICTEDYSRGYVWKNDKTVRFEIKDRFALFAGPRLHNMASLYGQLDTTKNLRDFFTITDLRIKLLKPATGATMVDENNLSRYFYAISDIKVQGRCKCNLHANSCVFDKGKLGCECEHNTTGPDCSRCKRHYHGRAWSVGSYLPIPKGTANICIPSNHGPVPRVCDNAMLRCQNGGTCHHHQRCHCSPGFTGVLCERARCQGPGECDDQLSGRATFHHPLIGCHLALTVILLPLVVVPLC